MISIQLPSIAIEKVSNGWLISWRKQNPEYPARTSERAVSVSAIAATNRQLIQAIEQASKDIDELSKPYVKPEKAE